MPNLTVYETLMFAAKLRHIATQEAIANRVNDVLMKMELDHVKNTRIGDAFVRGLSGGQRRRSELTSTQQV